MTDPDPEASAAPGRGSLSRDRILRSAIALADRDGIAALTMRAVARALGVEAMSLYHHVSNKDDMLDGLADAIAAEIVEATDAIDVVPPRAWKRALRARILAARAVMLRHPWAPAVFESRVTIGPAVIRYYDATLGVLRAGGLSHDLIHHASHALGSRMFGFSQELFDPAGAADEPVSEEMLEQMAAQAPNIVAMLADVAHDDPGSTLGWCDDQTEFEFGLDLLLDGLERRASGH